jgi:hypothetical protein
MKKLTLHSLIFVAFALIAAAGTSCKNANTTSPPAYNGEGYAITAQVENGDALNSIISELHAASLVGWGWEEGKATYETFPIPGVYADGGFSIILPETPNAKFLKNMGEQNHPDYYQISDRNTNYFVFNEIHAFDNNGFLVAALKLHLSFVEPCEYEGEVGEYFEVHFWYVDRDVTFFASADDGSCINLDLKKGWNKVYNHCWQPTGNCCSTTVRPDWNVQWRFVKIEE